VRVHVLQGEREMAADNQTLGRFELLGIPPAPRGVPQIEVTFDIDTDGVVKVSAKDLGTGRSQEIRVTAGSGLSEDQIRQLCSDADANKEADRRRRELAELRNRGDGLVYSTESTLADYGEHVTADERAALEAALARTREALAGEDMAEIQGAVDELTQLSYKMTEKLYSALGG